MIHRVYISDDDDGYNDGVTMMVMTRWKRKARYLRILEESTDHVDLV